MYRCPGETYDIDRAVHLGRLATFYTKCGSCPHRGDTATLPKQQVRHLAIVHSQPAAEAAVTDEGIVGVYRNQLTPARTREYAAALGHYLRASTEGKLSAVLVAGDDRPLTPEFVAAACEGLRRAGCRAIDLGTTASAGLVCAFSSTNAIGGLLVGNPGADPHVVGLRFWGPQARPISIGHGLEAVAQIASGPMTRGPAAFGGFDRIRIDEEYLDGLRDDFHALRPLRFVLDTGCGALKRYLARLTECAACEVIEAGESCLPATRTVDETPAKGNLRQRPPALPCSSVSARLKPLGRRVVEHAAHFGVWIDGDGETCHVADERGIVVTGDALLLLLARRAVQLAPECAFVAESSTAFHVVQSLHSLGTTTLACGETRAEMYDRMRDSGATIGGGPSGRFFHATTAPPALPSADALKSLALLLGTLSTSDRPLSQVAALR